MRRHGLTHEITRVTNTIASDARNDMSSRMQDSYREINMGPQPIVGGYGEARPFSAKEVRSVFFVVMCLKWLPGYVIGHSTGVHVWWKDDEVAHAQGVLILGRSFGGVTADEWLAGNIVRSVRGLDDGKIKKIVPIRFDIAIRTRGAGGGRLQANELAAAIQDEVTPGENCRMTPHAADS